MWSVLTVLAFWLKTVIRTMYFLKQKYFLDSGVFLKVVSSKFFPWSVWSVKSRSAKLRVMKVVEQLHRFHRKSCFQTSLRPSRFHPTDRRVGHTSKCSQHGFVELMETLTGICKARQQNLPSYQLLQVEMQAWTQQFPLTVKSCCPNWF